MKTLETAFSKRFSGVNARWQGRSYVKAACLLIMSSMMPAYVGQAQEEAPSRQELTEEAEALYEGLEGILKANPEAEVTPDRVPGFTTDEPEETEYYDNDPKINNEAVAASFTEPSATTVRQSMEMRPGVTAEELEEWTANGFSIEQDAQAIVTEYSGTYGDCETEITGGSGDTTYIYTCDEGETIQRSTPSCDVDLQVEVDFTDQEYIYYPRLFWNAADCAHEPDALHLQASNHGCQFQDFGAEGGDLCLSNGRGGIESCGGQCADIIFQAVCATPIPGISPAETRIGPPDLTDTILDAACSSFETNTDCSLETEICVEGPETRTINGLEVTRDCWKWERAFQCVGLGGAVTDCDPPSDTCQLIDSTCLSTDDVTGECRTTEHMYECTVEGAQGGAVGYCEEDVYCISGDCYTLVREQNDEFPEALSALSLLGELQNDVNDETLEIFPGENLNCKKGVFGLKNCCSIDGFLASVFGCSTEEEELKLRQDEGHCTYVGTYCSKKALFGICVTKTRAFCCFNNNLARIVHEQGRPQLPRDFGDPEEPDCAGFTVAEFQMLDLSTVDFSEFHDQVLEEFAGPDPDGTAAAITQRILDNYACPPNC